MIIVQLAGGLGNQMFQYASARGIQRNAAEPIILDLHLLRPLETDIEKIVQRPYSLSIFGNLKAKSEDYNLHQLLTKTDILTKIKRKVIGLQTDFILQHELTPVRFPEKRKINTILAGNFQSESAFKSIRKDLLHEFSFPQLDAANEHIKNEIECLPHAVSLHIRRGDYHSAAYKHLLTSVNIDYYNKAITRLKTYLTSDTLDIFVFTDDVPWVRSHFKDDQLNIRIVEGNNGQDAWKDMYLMTCCRHHILANSSFSWWGAWLAPKEGYTLAPKYWFWPDSFAHDIQDIIPPSWSILDYTL